jgi:NAD+ kinase
MIKQVAADTPDPRLLKVAADAVEELTQQFGVHVLLEPTTAARLKHYHGVDGPRIHLFENHPTPGFGTNLKPNEVSMNEVDDEAEYDAGYEDSFGVAGTRRPTSSQLSSSSSSRRLMPHRIPGLAGRYATAPSHTHPDLICTLGGDGLLMHVGMMFQGPAPPILCISGGSMGFLTPFFPDEMVEAICISLGIRMRHHDGADGAAGDAENIDVYPPNMSSYPYEPLPTPSIRRKTTSTSGSTGRRSSKASGGDRGGVAASTNLPAPTSATFGLGNRICLSIRMRLECRVLNSEGIVRSRYNVLNEVVIDRGSSPYLAALECFVDDVHLTTVQADGVIFATPTGSTAYSLAAGSSVVHPAVPCILVTPICPHVLSFRSMVFPDHVVLRCYVPHDARSEASVAFDGKHRQGLARGDSVQVQMSLYPVPTINKLDHSSDWLSSLKRSFSFNTRARQEPL